MQDPFSTAVSAFRANALAIGVTGDNLANLNTAGYKANRAEFHDLVAQIGGPDHQVGSGVVAQTARLFTQGSFDTTGAPLDAAIQGSGFFVTKNTQGDALYTRAGNFRLDSSGFLTTATGERVQGWNAASGVITANGAVEDLQVRTGGILPPEKTTQLSMRINLNETAQVGDSFSAPVTVVDSLGETHNVTVTLTKVSVNTWDYEVFIPGEDLAAGTPGTPSSLGTGTLTFGPDGLLDPATVSPVAITATGLANGAADLAVDWSVLNGTDSLLTHFAEPSALSSIDQNGRLAAEFQNVRIGDSGILIARYTQGVEIEVGRLAVAGISNPETLLAAGNNNFQVSSSTATPTIGAAGTGGRGDIRGGSLESSTVDLAKEFTNLIKYQRSYQASSRMVTTQDDILQETLNLKR